MRFMIIRKADKETEAGALPTTQLMTDMLNYNQELANAGMLLDGMGLQPTSKGFRVKFSGGKPKVTDGPFTEAKELAYRQMRFSGAMKYALPWLHNDLDEIDELFGGDPFVYGVEANRASLSALASYLFDQGFVERPIDIDSIFAPIIADSL